MRIICFQHVPFEGPAAIGDWADLRSLTLTMLPLYEGAQAPSGSEFDILVVLGGPMNIYEEAQYPWLRREKAAIREAIASAKVVFGVCLGAQLIADTLGSSMQRVLFAMLDQISSHG